jgi:hypothetical protein
MPHSRAGEAALWTGRLAFELYSRRGWRAGVAELVVRHDTVDVWTRRPLGTFHRGELRRWLRVQDGPLTSDDITWLVVRSAFAVQLAGSDPYGLPDDVANHLLRML